MSAPVTVDTAPEAVPVVVTAKSLVSTPVTGVLKDDPDVTLVRLSTYAATLIVNHLHTHTYRLSKK